MKKARVDVYPIDALYVASTLNDFNGDVQKWKNAIYELFRLDMTYSYAYKIEVNENRNSGVFVCVTCKPVFEEVLLETMNDLGFREIKTQHDNIGTIECTELPIDMLIDFAIVNY